MTCTEEYKEHIEYTFHAFCKIVIRNASYTALRTWSRKHICSKSQSQLKYNRQVNDEGITVRGRFLICGLNGDKVVGLSKDQADRYSRLLFLPQVEDMLQPTKTRRSASM